MLPENFNNVYLLNPEADHIDLQDVISRKLKQAKALAFAGIELGLHEIEMADEVEGYFAAIYDLVEEVTFLNKKIFDETAEARGGKLTFVREQREVAH